MNKNEDTEMERRDSPMEGYKDPPKLTKIQLDNLDALQDLICCELGSSENGKRRRITLDQQTRLWKHIGNLIGLNLTINGFSQEFEDKLLADMKEHNDYCKKCEKGEVKCKCSVWRRKDMFSDKWLNTNIDEDDDSNEGGSTFVSLKEWENDYKACDCSTTDYKFKRCNCKKLGDLK